MERKDLDNKYHYYDHDTCGTICGLKGNQLITVIDTRVTCEDCKKILEGEKE